MVFFEKKIGEGSFCRTRPTSGPYISGDTFRCLGERVVERGIWFRNRTFIPGLVFAEADEVDSLDFFNKCRQWTARNPTKRHQLVIHNGDRQPKDSSLVRLTSIFAEVFSTNVLWPVRGVTAIPVGLENAHHRKNGVVSRFDRASKLNQQKPPTRTRDIGVSFNARTNEKVRSPLVPMFRDAGHEFQAPVLHPRDYIHWVRSSKFIVSPPGNGHDCHRTWEAIYLGTIPVTLEGHLHPDLVTGCPILSVPSFEEFAKLSPMDLDRKFREIAAKDSKMAYANYWVQRMTAGSRL